jgi:uncharacterized protein (DUF697 family)
MTEALLLTPQNNSAYNTLSRLETRNDLARAAIKKWADRHAAMDVGIGAAGLFGLAIPALVLAIGAQAPVIYQPCARELAQIYNSPVDEETGSIVIENIVFTGAADIAADFGMEFIQFVASELLTEAGFGAALGFIPIVGGIFGATLDYVIATAMTWRVGTMVAIYYQNGGTWVKNRKYTFELAKEMVGGVSFGIKDLAARFSGRNRQQLEVDFTSIQKIPEVFHSQVRNLRPVVTMMLKALTIPQVRELLRAQGIPVSLIEAVLNLATVGRAT